MGAPAIIGKTISHCRIVSKIGQGGMGVVYRAEDERLRWPVALRARRWYGCFLTDWKEPDADIPEVAEARNRFSALGGPQTPGD